MGGSQSTQERRMTVENENAIQVSQDVLNRIQDQLNTKASQAPPQEAPPPQVQYIPQEFYYGFEDRKNVNVAEEAYWAQRIEDLKREHSKINASMDIEYQKTLKEANQLFEIAQSDKLAAKLPCQEEKAKVLDCYSTNPNKTLLCSVLVNQFNDCVCRSRIATLSAS
ncbi:hypothetical protein NE865_13274 [Phthorimaea operculella]|nr:hypothetical protein NE865_13274 [Phthorimaea operculella]